MWIICIPRPISYTSNVMIEESSGKKTILIVEDDALLLNILKTGFEKIGLEVQLAADGVEALARLSEKTPDIVLLDILLPQKDGFEVLQSIKKDPKTAKVPVIIISNLAGTADVEKGKVLGASDYLIKAETSIDSLVKTIKQYAGR